MTLDEFKQTLTAGQPPAGLSEVLKALWYDARADWDMAHHVAQDIDSPTGAWIHAYLHRKEGDLANAGYWYRRAGKPEARDAFADEWGRIAAAVLAGEA
jgi:hypothetical protein